MRILTSLCLALGLTGMVLAQTQTIDFEPPTYSVGALVGQDSWTCCIVGSDSSGFTVDNTVFSPMGSSTQSLKVTGVGSGNRIGRLWPTAITSGIWRIGYDYRFTGTAGVYETSPLYTTADAQVAQPYMVPGASGATQNMFACTGPNGGGGYGGLNIMSGFTYSPDTWYRFEWLMDFGQHIILDFNIYDISSGSKVLVANNYGTLYFNYSGGAYVDDFDKLGIRMDAADGTNSWWMDNYSVAPSSLPPMKVQAVASPQLVKATVPYQQQMLTYIPGETVNWTLDNNGGTGATISGTGLISGWTPNAGQIGSQFPFQVTGQNARGSDTVSWQAKVISQYDLGTLPFDAQINLGAGDAYRPATDWTWMPAGGGDPDAFGRHYMPYGYFNHQLYLTSAGYPVADISSCHSRLTVSLRVHHESGDYGDGPVFLKLHSTNGGTRDFNLIFGTGAGQLNDPADAWVTKTIWLSNSALNPYAYSDSGGFDPTQVQWIEFWGTCWVGSQTPPYLDYTDFNNLSVTNEPVAPVVTPVTPDPQTALVGMPYSQQMGVTPCTEGVTWALAPNGTGATIDSNGLVSGWTPTQAQAGQTFTFEVQATNTAGSATDSWQVTVYQPPASDGSNIAQPWGTLHGNIYATQSSDDPSLLFDSRWSNDVQVDWSYTASTDGLTGTTERGGITFDESGNLYWKTDEGLLASLTPAGTLRWKGNVAGTPVDLGSGDTTAPVIGDGGATGRVYVLGDSGLYAFQKSDGAQLWIAALPDANFASTGDRLTPVLYEGRVYVVGAGDTTKTVYEVDAATGAVVWAKAIAVNLDTGWGDAKGAMTLLPNALGAGIHGLYFNADGSGDGTDVYCIAVNTNTYSGSLQWMADGGKAVRSHVIYSATTGRLYTATWGDDGKQFYSYSPTTGLLFGNNSAEGSGHGYNDFGVLDFSGTDVIAAGFGGNVIRYHDTGDGSTTSTFYPTSTNFGEFRMYGGLFKDSNGDSIAVMATRSTEGPNARVLAYNLTASPQVTCSSYEDSAVYVDNLKITHGATGVETTRLDVSGFEGYALGDLPGQANPGGTGAATWDDDTGGGASGVGKVQVVNTLPAGGSGKGIMIDAAGGCGGWQGAFANLGGSLTDTVVIVSWDQYRGDLTDNQWFAENPDYSGWWAYAWDQNGTISARNFDGAVSLAAGVWEHIVYRFDFGAATPTVTVTVSAGSATQNLDAAETSIRGWDFEVEGTLKDNDFTPTPITPIFSHDTGMTTDPISGLQMGPVVGDAVQHIYYWGAGKLVALTYVKPIPGDFNGDGVVDENDYTIFEDCATGPGIPNINPSCDPADLDPDGDIDQTDFGQFQKCFGGSDANCLN